MNGRVGSLSKYTTAASGALHRVRHQVCLLSLLSQLSPFSTRLADFNAFVQRLITMFIKTSEQQLLFANCVGQCEPAAARRPQLWRQKHKVQQLRQQMFRTLTSSAVTPQPNREPCVPSHRGRWTATNRRWRRQRQRWGWKQW